MASTDLEQFTEWVNNCGIDTHAYGTGAYKTVAQLLKEVKGGDCQLSVDGEPIDTSKPWATQEVGLLKRHVCVVSVELRTVWKRFEYVLVEEKQQLADGRVRYRSMPDGRAGMQIAEKMHADEDVFEAVRRALMEEVGLSARYYIIDTENVDTITKTAVSPSYPELITENQTKYVEAELQMQWMDEATKTALGMPKGEGEEITLNDFSTTEEDGKINYWTWKSKIDWV